MTQPNLSTDDLLLLLADPADLRRGQFRYDPKQDGDHDDLIAALNAFPEQPAIYAEEPDI